MEKPEEKGPDGIEPTRRSLVALIKANQSAGRLGEVTDKIKTHIDLTQNLDPVRKAFEAARASPLQTALDQAATTDWQRLGEDALGPAARALKAARASPLQSILDQAVTTDWQKQLRDQTFKLTSSPALDHIEALHKRITNERFTPDVFTSRELEAAPQPPLISSGFVSLHSVMEREAEEKRVRDERQTALLSEMVDTAKIAVAAAERDALDSRKSAQKARIWTLLTALTGVMVGWETIQKLFLLLAEKLP